MAVGEGGLGSSGGGGGGGASSGLGASSSGDHDVDDLQARLDKLRKD